MNTHEKVIIMPNGRPFLCADQGSGLWGRVMWQYELSQKTRSDQHRNSQRKDVDHIAMLSVNGRQIGVRILDLSTSGARLGLPRGFPDAALPETMRLDIPGLFILPVKKRWQTETEVGVEFAVERARRAMFGKQMQNYLRHRPSAPRQTMR